MSRTRGVRPNGGLTEGMEIARENGVRLYWTAAGTGPTVVLSHGWLADHRVFDRLTPSLVEGGFRVVRWDVRAHGRSSRGMGPTSFPDLVADLRAVATAAGGGPVTLVGHDLGAQLSMALSVEPGAWRGASLWSIDPALAVTHRARQALLTAAQHVTIRPLVLGLEALWFKQNPEHDPALATHLRRTATTLSAAAVREVAAADPPDFTEIVNRLTIPVQILWGDADRLLRPYAGKELLSRIPHATGRPIPDAAHQIAVDQPRALEQELLAWLRQLPSAE